MAMNPSLVSFCLCFLVFFHGSCAQIEQVTSSRSSWAWTGQQLPWQRQRQQQQHRLRSQCECRIENLNAQEPSRRIRSEAGTTEFWDQNDEQFQCAGVAAARHIIEPKGLLLPSFANAPHLTYIIQGRCMLGVIFPGCTETFQSEQSQTGGSQTFGGRGRQGDQHQKIHNVREGDILAFPAGASHWAYNNGDKPLIAITIFDTSSEHNQLDQNLRHFFLAGNPRHEEQEGGGRRGQEGRREQEGRRGERFGQGNLFSGFDERILAQAFNVRSELIRNLQGQNDNRGSIIRVQDKLRVISPQMQGEEREWEQEREYGSRRGERENGVDETFCSLRLKYNIDNPSHADVYNPRGGHITSLNSQKLPILSFLQLSAERGKLYRNAILAPQYNINAHSIVYITKGNSRMQIVGDNGNTAFDGEVREGQLIIVPQNFAVIKRAGEQGCEWIAIKTNDNAMISPIAGRLSPIRGMPIEVLMNAYEINRDQANQLKYNRDELTVFGPGSRSGRDA